MNRGEESSTGFVVPDLGSMPVKKYRIPNVNFAEIKVESNNEYGTTYLMCMPKKTIPGGMDVEGYSSMWKR